MNPVLIIVLLSTAAYSLDLPECKKYECADYKVIEKRENYEVRRYDAYKIATVTSKGLPWLIADYFNFMKLFKYIGGNNDKGIKMSMTAPVLNLLHVDVASGELVKDQTQMVFFMSKHLSGGVPKPFDEKVTIDDFGPFTVYAKSFGGHMNTQKVLIMQRQFHDELKADGVEFIESIFATASYNHPMQVWNRHNDVFYMAKEKNSL